MKTNFTKPIGYLLITGALALLIPYAILTVIFNYPMILREDTATILTRFNDGGSQLIFTWFAFAVTGIPLIPAYIFIGQSLERKDPIIRTATVIGITGLLVQMVGLLRWTFVVPVLSTEFVNSTDLATKSAIIIAFKTIHQFAGVLLGEHLGQLFTIAWTIMVSISFMRLQLFPKWVSAFGLVSAGIYLLAQAELFQTVMPTFPAWSMAGFIGSTLWLIWLIVVGTCFIKITGGGRN